MTIKEQIIEALGNAEFSGSYITDEVMEFLKELPLDLSEQKAIAHALKEGLAELKAAYRFMGIRVTSDNPTLAMLEEALKKAENQLK